MCSSTWTTGRSCSSTSSAPAPIPTTGPRWPRPCSRNWRGGGASAPPPPISTLPKGSPRTTPGPATPPGRSTFGAPATQPEPLRGCAATAPRARNASVEFDAERLEPTFRLVYDRPGQSYALAIGARLGLPPALIARAQAHRTTQGRALQALLARLDARDRQDAERAALMERREVETAGLLTRAQEIGRASCRERVEISVGA